MKNAVAMLLLSQGVPMLLMGDELGRSQNGNNNTYCQDNELNWIDWELKETNSDLFRFFQAMIAFRKAHPVLRHAQFAGAGSADSGVLELAWHGTRAWQPDWSGTSRVLAFHARLRGVKQDDIVYAAFNMYWESLPMEPPVLECGRKWHLFADTGNNAPLDIHEVGHEPPLSNARSMQVAGRSVVILVAR
jgi:glycogen operon protein